MPEDGARFSALRLDALTYPDEFFDWIVAFESLSRLETRSGMLDALRDARRVPKTGGWLYVAVPGIPEGGDNMKARGYAGDSGRIPSFTPQTLEELLEESGLRAAERPAAVLEDGRRFVRAIFRKTERQPYAQASR
jgi:SAM-dependent methyltransferase